MSQFRNDEEDFDEDEALAGDYDTPFSAPMDGKRSRIDHPSRDSNVDELELYNEG